MTAWRRIIRRTCVPLAVLLLAAAVVLGLVQTPLGKRGLAAAIGWALTDKDERVVVTGITGFVPFDVAIAQVETIDAAGPRVVLGRVRFALAPRELLRGSIRLTRLDIATVAVARRGSGGGNLAELRNLPLSLRIDQATIDTLTLGRDLLGERVVAALSGSLALGRGAAAADLDLHRIDGTPGDVRLHAALGGTPPRLELTADTAEPSGRLLAQWLGRSEPLPLALHLAGKGPLADWRGSLAARAGPDASLDAAFRFADKDGYRLSTEGDARVAPLLSPRFAALIGDGAHFNAAASLVNGALTVGNLSVVAGAGTLQASGHVAAASGVFAGHAALTAPDLAKLSPLLGDQRLGGAARTTLTLGGDPGGWRARVAIDATGFAFDDNKAQTARATIDLGAKGDIRDAAPVAISGSGTVLGLALAQGPLPGGLGERLDWQGAARLDRAMARVDVEDLTLSSARNTLVAQFRAGAGIDGTAHLDVPEVAPLAQGKVRGALALDADFHAGADGSAVVVLGGTMRRPSSGVAALDRLLGASVAIAATLRRGADGALGASEISIDGESLQLAGAAERHADGTTHADATLRAQGIAAGGIAVDRLDAKAALDDLQQPRGRIEARFQSGGIEGTASADAAFVPGETLRLERLHLDAAKTRLDATLTFDLARARADGTIAAAAADLKLWSALLGTPLGGSAELRATLRGGASQSVDATLTGRDLAWGTRSAQRLEATLRLADLLGKPTGRGSLSVETAALGAAKLERLTLAGTSDRPGRFALTLATRGKLIETFTLGGGATLTLQPPGGALRVTRLAGAFGRETLRLRRPLRVTAGDDAFAFADLDLAFGKGSISGAGATKGETLSLDLLAKGLPVRSMAELGNVQGVSGALGFRATLSGTRTRPRGELVLDAEQLRFAADRPDLPPLGFVLRGRWREDRLEAEGRLAGPANAAIGFSAGIPLSFAKESLVSHVPPQGALALRLEGEGELASFADLLPVGEDRLAGHFLLAIDVGGTVAAPRASGRLSLRNGRYESRIWGTTFAGVSIDLVGSRDQLVLQHFSATDGAKGRATLQGVLDLAAAAGPSFHLTGGFQNFRAVNRDEAKATMSGSASLQGSLLAPRLGAQLTILQAEIEVPKQLASNLRPIPVTIIDSANGARLATPGTSPARAALLALAFDVEVALPGKVFVRGRGLDSEWRGELHVTGTTAAPSILGKL
ncbi:MAG TPA: translocation/assembly module TamB domain-containing protein, partial [Stellaceae bacterium]|nr:translocation/assembly module TamB domain-containing protein [Stellaceae bacterium]